MVPCLIHILPSATWWPDVLLFLVWKQLPCYLLCAAFLRHSSQAEPSVPIPHFHRLSTYLLSNQTPLVDYPSIRPAGLRAPEGQRCCHTHLGFLTPDWGWMLSSCSVSKEAGKESWNVPNLLTTHMTYKYTNTFEIRHCTWCCNTSKLGQPPVHFPLRETINHVIIGTWKTKDSSSDLGWFIII